MPTLAEPRAQASRPFVEPLRPTDAAWRGRNGSLRKDLGPMLPLVRLQYLDGTPAVELQEDGSGFAMYPSGRKAVCAVCHNRSRRMGAIVYAERDFVVHSAASADARPGADGDNWEELGPRAKRSRHLGALDEWGIGQLQTTPDSSSGARGSYQVTRSNVSVTHADGRKIQVPRNSASAMAANVADLKLRLNSEILVSYDAASGTTLLEFASGGVQHNFYFGEVWRGGATTSPGKTTSPAAVIGSIALHSQSNLDNANLTLTGSLGTLNQTLKNSSGTLNGRSLQMALQQHGLATSSSAPDLTLTPQDLAKSFTQGRIQWKFENELRKKLATEVAPPLARPLLKKDLREGFSYPRAPVGKPPLWPQKVLQPKSLKAVSARQLSELVSSQESGGEGLLVVLVTGSWASGLNSSSEHARSVCEAAYGALDVQGLTDRVDFCVTEASEAGAIHSEAKFSNPVVKQHGVKSVPWMLMFSNGKLVLSRNPSPLGQPEGGGLGFTSRLRYMALAKPRVLVLEPVPDYSGWSSAPSSGPVSANPFKLQLETQNVLKQSGFSFDLATTLAEARRMLTDCTPAYGILLATSEIGASALTEVASRMRSRNAKALAFVVHNIKDLGALDESMRALAAKGDLVHGVLRRPVTKSSLERELTKHHDAVKVDYPECGLSRETLVELISSKLIERPESPISHVQAPAQS